MKLQIRAVLPHCFSIVLLGLCGCLAASAAPIERGNVPEVSVANWYWGPQNRWSWQNARRIFPTSQISRGTGPVVELPHAERDLTTIAFTDPVSHRAMTVGEMLDTAYTDGFLVLQQGNIVIERYGNGLTPQQPHLLMSVSKSIMGTLAGILVGQGKIDPQKPVTDYVPEMKGTVYDGASLRNLLDMTVDDPTERTAMKTASGTAKEYEAVDEAGGWLPATSKSAPGLRAYLLGLRRPHGHHGQKFLYLDQSAILIGWVMERATGKDLSELLATELWSKLGPEQDAYMLLDRHQQAYSSAGVNATLRDVGRFAEMMAHGGRYNDQQIVPEAWIDDIRSNGKGPDASDHGPSAPAPWPGHGQGRYRDFWWLADAACGRFAGVGLGGQLVIVDPLADMVAVKLDSVPNAALDDNVYQTQYAAIDAIIKTIGGHGCAE